MVGAREATPYGIGSAGRLGLELARGGALVVSGMAQGIDTASVQGALKGGGPVVSVLGGGVDVPYPRENRWLYEDVAAAGPSSPSTRRGRSTGGSTSRCATASSAACAWG